MKKLLILSLFLAVLNASCSQRWCNARYPQVASQDSLYIETVKEIPVYLPGDSILVDVPVNCPDQDIANVETGKLKQEISILKGRLVSHTIIKPDTVFIHTTNTVTKTQTIKVPEKIKVVPKFFKFCTLAFIFIVLFFIAYLGFKYKVKILSLFKLFR